MASSATITRPSVGPRTSVLPPSLAAARARGFTVRAAPTPPRAPWAPAPRRHTPDELVVLLGVAVARRGIKNTVDVGVFAACHALLVHVRRQAATAARGRRGNGATARTSSSLLVRSLASTMGWDTTRDRWEDRDVHQSSVRRWLRDLQAAHLVRVDVVLDDEGQERAIDVTLLEAPWIPDEWLTDARRRLTHWRKRYGQHFERSRRAGPIMAALTASRKAIADRYAGPPSGRRKTRSCGIENESGTPPWGAKARTKPKMRKQLRRKASCGASACAQAREGDTRNQAPSDQTLRPTQNADPTPFGSKEWGLGADLESLELRVAARKQRAIQLRSLVLGQLADSERIVRNHVPTPQEPLPPLPPLRRAIAGRLVGVDDLAAGVPIPGLGDKYVRRLHAAAARWVHFAPAGAPTPAAGLLELAEQMPGRSIAELVRHFARRASAMRDNAKTNGPAAQRRLDAIVRRARRDPAGTLQGWPSWLRRDGDRPVRGGDWERFLHVHRLPTDHELADPQTRRWLRDATALWFGTPLAAVELTDPAGHYVYVPLHAPSLRRRGDRTRSPWRSTTPRRRGRA